MLRGRLTYANVMVTILAFFVFGGGVVWAAGPGPSRLDRHAVTRSATGFTKVVKREATGKRTAKAKCPANTWLVGGGGSLVGNASLVWSYPASGPKGGSWLVRTNGSNTVHAFALCAS